MVSIKYLNTFHNNGFLLFLKPIFGYESLEGKHFWSFVFLTLVPEGRDAGKPTQCWQPVEWLVTKADMNQILTEIYNTKFSRKVKKS